MCDIDKRHGKIQNGNLFKNLASIMNVNVTQHAHVRGREHNILSDH